MALHAAQGIDEVLSGKRPTWPVNKPKKGDRIMAFIPKGIIPAMVTPLTKDGKVNEKGLRKFIDYLIDGGSHGLFVVGTTGEFYGLSPEEKKELFEITVDQTRGRVPVYAGTGAITTREAIHLTRYAEEAKVDAVSVLTPMFISPSSEGTDSSTILPLPTPPGCRCCSTTTRPRPG